MATGPISQHSPDYRSLTEFNSLTGQPALENVDDSEVTTERASNGLPLFPGTRSGRQDLTNQHLMSILAERGFDSAPAISGPAIQKQVLLELKKINEDPDVFYMSEFRQRQNPDDSNETITKRVSSYGFTRPSSEEYVYSGDDPAQALHELLAVRPLILDCATALHLLTYQALLKALGGTRFNAYIQEACHGVLEIRKQKAPPLPSNQTAYYCARHEQNENALPKDLQMGDHLWIQGPAHGYAFHPASDANGFNVRVDTTNPKQPLLVGFVSEGTATPGCWPYDKLRELLLEAYNAPLTLRDLSYIANSQESAPYSSWTYKDAYGWLAESQPKALTKAMGLLSGKNVDLDQETELFPPKSDGIRGVVQQDRPRQSLTFTQLTKGGDKLSTVAINPVIQPDRKFGDWIPHFDTSLPHQRQIYAVMEEFYSVCTDATNQRKFHGAMLYGNAGTGKTMACNALVDRLQKEGYPIWKTNFNEGKTLLSLDEMKELLEIFGAEGREACTAKLIEKFKPDWDKAKIIFIDDTNNKYGALADVSNAAVRYARQTGKKIVITCNSDPIQAFQSTIEFPCDSIFIRHIEGPDYRAANAWHHKVLPTDYPAPDKIGNCAATGNQKLIQQWLQALDAHPGHNGVAFYGQPGMGKTTALKEYFSSKGFNTFWIESHTLPESIHLPAKLGSSDAEYLVIDDCNDPKGNHQYRRVLYDLLNNETLVNKNGQPVRVVLVSNRNSWQELVNDATSSDALLSPRMNSRYHGRFVSIGLEPDEDFRAHAPKAGVIAKPGAVSVPKGTYALSIAQYVEERSKMEKIFERYHRMKYPPSTHGGFGLQMHLSPANQQAYDNAWNAIQYLETSTLEQINNAQGIEVNMTGCDDKDKWAIKDLMRQVLDVMDAKPDYHVTIVSDDPHKTMEQLKEIMAEVDKTGKYSSRLQRLDVQ